MNLVKISKIEFFWKIYFVVVAQMKKRIASVFHMRDLDFDMGKKENHIINIGILLRLRHAQIEIEI